jgi:enoyl-CoA hydratase/carnithine racemase
MSIPSGLETVKIELDEKNRIAKVILHRPEQLNTFNLVMRDDINHALRWASEDDRVRVIILTGAGRAFCAGADLSVNKADTFNSTAHKEGVDDHRDSGAQLSMAFFRCLKPVISVVNGPAVGIGNSSSLVPLLSSLPPIFSSQFIHDAIVVCLLLNQVLR